MVIIMGRINVKRYRVGFEPNKTQEGWVVALCYGQGVEGIYEYCNMLDMKPREIHDAMVEFGAYPSFANSATPHFLFKEDVTLFIDEFIEARVLALHMGGWKGCKDGATIAWTSFMKGRNKK